MDPLLLLKQNIDKNNFNVFIRDLSTTLNTNLKHIIEDNIINIPKNNKNNYNKNNKKQIIKKKRFNYC